MKKLTAYLLVAAALAGCGKKDETVQTKSDAAPETKQDENLVILTKENLANVTLKTEPAQLGSLGMTLKAAGRVSANLNKTAKVTPTLEGRLTKLNFDLNDQVMAGDVMALVESPELLGKPLELKAMIDGVVTERSATTGELVDKSKTIYTISDPTQLWAIAEVKERDISAVKLDQDAAFTTLAFPDEKFHGKVVLIGNQVETGSRTVEVRIAVDNADGRLKPGMFADVEIVTTILDNVLLIPDNSLETDGENQIVFVALDGNKFEKRVVKLGLEQAGRVQILAGVKAGEKIVTGGGFILKSEMLKGQLGEE
ncbi:MAG TPA: efflux RND transporter periplasmic adaptor subunit [Candidatus Paceibacterota bacterium]|nr:efflux RND transporter periplasmic adaptor subunit [Candidatus Paceibacterota bacterium]